ncbi:MULTISPECIES: acetate--CoA ligase [unclassified Haladaptatus]|uniref:acetate--CoA ligase n=1 Tax=unclassified Haladaptatus TaxID=2622732 RepID=UPI00209BD8FA|nr:MULTISPECIES: acetate--CoA ligase [unclassified Haladaptatus]MCO8245467.1 acetate--CoA ligase [Haladaptatus sp. AB643]MCO8256579.1 acetate--CoA ligase [Haladaptatus sp. AB618]
MVDDDNTEAGVELDTRLEETESFEPPKSFVEQANISDPSIYDEFEENWPKCWSRAADLLDWDEKYDTILDDSKAPFYKWFTGGSLNASYNCLDRHLGNRGNEVAIEWIGELGETRTYTYEDLHREVNEFAAALREIGVGEDDVVTIYLPIIPELTIAMLACARIGAPHSVVFAGFSADALATRIENAGSEHLITCDGYYRRGDPLQHKTKADKGLSQTNHDVEEVVVVDRLGDEYDHPMENGEHKYEDLISEQKGAEVKPVPRDSEDMLFLMYTSGTTGEPKGVKHTTAGYLSYASWTSHAVLDIKPEDTYWCSADIGWITGHSYIVYGPLSLGTTSVLYEGTPDYPDKDRFWEIIEEYEIDILYTAPTAIRAFMKWGEQYPRSHDLSSLRLLGTVGEPINPRAWKWYYKHVGDEKCPIVDTWWQTETGGMMVTTLPAIETMKPGSAGPPLPGIDAQIVDTKGEPVGIGQAGYLTVQKPWPGMLRTVYNNDDRYISEYWQEYSDPDADKWVYFPEDGAKLDEDDYITVIGRVDDVLNVSGHRLGTMEIESAIVGVEGIAEAAVVGGAHELKGEAVYAYVITEDSHDSDDAMHDRIVAAIEDTIGPIARPEEILFTPELPKTQSGKIMRRLLEDVANDDDLGDTSTLRNPDVIEEIQAKRKSTKD